ncbi:AciT family ciprofloxacin tolerance protein [Acinetobacter sp. MD2(2019)]|uniref:AciT family ciprofloxacin tolerance protein n=1 Tax=Acinetobacter sp. MD2(2019) TaxID=2605273 RepID=UPI002D1E79A4|nr:AciT family ciprofloxacin tolerance protein [Acinetobacter sp. MD2(2019)]MEB3754909.1 hypothetical protein [Acinetobacter sp. MD2(2019)]
MFTANFASFVGLGLILIALVAVFFSPFRHWLGFMLAGMGFWGTIELVRLSVQHLLQLPITYSYLTALMCAMAVITLVLLRADRMAQKALANRQLIEHTPVYDDEQ